MLDFQPDSSLTGGTIDNWYVDNDEKVPRTRTPHIRHGVSIVPVVTSDNQISASEHDPDLPSSDQVSSSDETTKIEKMCDDRLTLLAKLYSESITPKYYREIQARVSIIERQLEIRVPRYTEQDWQLLAKFQQLVEAL